MKVPTWFGSVFAILFLAAALQAQSRETLLKYIDESPDWSPAGNAKQYDDKTIDALAAKSAPTIKRYGLNGVSIQDWSGAAGKVRLTMYEMVDTSAAYGLFTFERNPDQPGFSTLPLGTEAFRDGNRTTFWQGKYVVRLDGDAKASEGLGRLVSQNIFGRSRKPDVSELLPPQNLVPNSEKYVIDAAGIDPALGLDAATLGFEDDVEAAVARYNVNGKAASLVLLLFPTQHVARKYADGWDTNLPDEKPFRKRAGPLVAMVRGSRDADLAKALLDPIGHEYQVTWNERRPDLTFREIIVTIFTFIGIAVLFTVVAGVSFGGFRIFIKSRYPGRVFDRAQDMEIIQLKLDEGLRRKELGS